MSKGDWLIATSFGAVAWGVGLALAAQSWWLAPLVPSVCAAAALARARHWKQHCGREMRRQEEILRSMAFEAANACNAIRANVIDFREVNAGAANPEHLDEIEHGAERVAAALEKAGVFPVGSR